jgi:hypothetical protein
MKGVIMSPPAAPHKSNTPLRSYGGQMEIVNQPPGSLSALGRAKGGKVFDLSIRSNGEKSNLNLRKPWLEKEEIPNLMGNNHDLNNFAMLAA